MVSHEALVYLCIKAISGKGAVDRALLEMTVFSWKGQLSSVYRQFETEQRYDFDSNLISVAKIQFDGETSEFLHQIKEIQTKLSAYLGREKVVIIPLAIDQDTQMIPENTLPHPLLHSDSLVVRCAAEVWSDYIHPVLGKPLGDIASQAPAVSNAEFMLQGKSLVQA